ncbi:MAG: GNAT family N-acetyltransferase [Clostridia bacterium]|nr:GNAT family N-acetyltransferase [Clostridia bacterium]
MELKFLDRNLFHLYYSCISEGEIDLSREYIDSDFDFGDFEVKFGYSSGCLIMRYYSDEAGYHFDAPFPLSDNADVAGAFFAISEYCKREGIAETVVGVYEEWRDLMLRGAEDYYEAEDEDGTYLIRIYTECMRAEELPEVMVDNVYLGEFAMKYADSYEKMLKDANLNCHFGYNILDDIPNGNGEDFINSARREFESGEAMTFAATVFENGENVFVGEGCLYAFDGRGACEASFRVLPERQRQGIGSKIFAGLLKIAKQVGLRKVICEVKTENVPSLNLMKKYAAPTETLKEKVLFEFVLE